LTALHIPGEQDAAFVLPVVKNTVHSASAVYANRQRLIPRRELGRQHAGDSLTKWTHADHLIRPVVEHVVDLLMLLAQKADHVVREGLQIKRVLGDYDATTAQPMIRRL